MLLAAIATSAQAQQGTPPTAQELAKSLQNPFEHSFKVQFQPTTGFNLGPHHNMGVGFSLQPTIPLSLSSQWDLFARPSLTFSYVPSPHEQFGLNDSQASFFLSPHSANEWVWGIGPIFQVPTATSDELGTGRWSAGPTAALIYENGPWFAGVLTYQLMSFAGNRARGSVNQTYVETQVSYNFESGWYVDTDPPMTFDWTADAADGWTIPLGADIGKAFSFDSQAMGFQVGVYDLAKRPQGDPQWILRIQLTALFPTGW